jgi:hypothetical protein
MAWTTPKTWDVDELLTAANMNAQVRDNLTVLGNITAGGVALSSGGTDLARIAVGSYTGNGADDRNITGIGFTPKMVLIKDNNGVYAVNGRWGSTGDLSGLLSAAVWTTNLVQALNSDGFQVGSNGAVNNNTWIYFYIAIG